MRGNTPTRDYVIRREFDIGEGDAYNKALIDRAGAPPECARLLQEGQDHQRGRAPTPDRVIINVDVEEQIHRLFLGFGRLFDDRRLPGGSLGLRSPTSWAAANTCVLAVSARPVCPGRRTELHRALLPRPASGGRLRPLHQDLTDASQYAYYSNWVTGGTIRFGVPITDEITFAPRYTLSTFAADHPEYDAASPITTVAIRYSTAPRPDVLARCRSTPLRQPDELSDQRRSFAGLEAGAGRLGDVDGRLYAVL